MQFITSICLCTPALLGAGGPTIDQVEWVGDWRFEECWKNLSGTSDCIEYRVKVHRQGKGLVAEIAGDGFQTYFRVQAQVRLLGNKATFIFSHASEEGLQKFKAGDVLFVLSQNNGTVYTTWEWLQASYKRLPAIQFERVKGVTK